MAPWLKHPRYVALRDSLVEYLRSDRYRFRRLAPVLFLCGGAGSVARDSLRDYLRKARPNIRLFYAEQVWDQIAARTGRSALEMEADLAGLADILIIIVESPGTFAELGAFSLSADLRLKLLPIVDRAYAGSNSFISSGPLRWIDSASQFAPTVFVPLARILECVDEVEKRLDRLGKAKPTRVDDLASSPKHLLFFIADLVAVIHPATVESIEHYLGGIAPSIAVAGIDLPTLLGLAVAMGLVEQRVITVAGHEWTFFRPISSEALEHPYHHKRMLDLPTKRAEHASVLMTIPVAVDAVRALRAAP